MNRVTARHSVMLAVACLAASASFSDVFAATLSSALDYLVDRGAHRVEDLSDADLLATRLLPATTNWRIRLRALAKVEAGRRGLTTDAFPLAASPLAPDKKRPPLQVSAADLEVLARIIKGETWWQSPHAARVAVASVVLNRYRAPGYPKTIAGVAHQPLQFSCYNEDVRNELYYGKIPDYCWLAARDAVAGVDPCEGATHYFNPYIVNPSWAKTLRFIKRIGDSPLNTHDFYRR
jgi:hypothetical protein